MKENNYFKIDFYMKWAMSWFRLRVFYSSFISQENNVDMMEKDRFFSNMKFDFIYFVPFLQILNI